MILIGCRSILELFSVKFQSDFRLGLVLSWFSFGWKISSENGKNKPFLQKWRVSTGNEN